MVVRQTRAATRKKMSGKTLARLPMRSASMEKLTKPILVSRSRIYHSLSRR